MPWLTALETCYENKTIARQDNRTMTDLDDSVIISDVVSMVVKMGNYIKFRWN